MICDVIEGFKYKPSSEEIIDNKLYKLMYNKIEDGDILLLAGKSLISRLIGRFSYSIYKWSHVAILFKEGNLILRVESTVPRPGIYLFDPERVIKGNYYYAIMRLSDVYKYKHRSNMLCLKEMAFKLALTKKYAIRGLLGWLTGRRPAKNAMVCSTFVYEVYRRCGIELIRAESKDRISPLDIWQSPLLEIVDFYSFKLELKERIIGSRQ